MKYSFRKLPVKIFGIIQLLRISKFNIISSTCNDNNYIGILLYKKKNFISGQKTLAIYLIFIFLNESKIK